MTIAFIEITDLNSMSVCPNLVLIISTEKFEILLKPVLVGDQLLGAKHRDAGIILVTGLAKLKVASTFTRKDRHALRPNYHNTA